MIPKKAIRHIVVWFLSFGIVLLFWFLHQEVPAHALWRAFGNVSFLLLGTALLLGPLSRLFKPAKKVLVWRREIGVWAVVHTVIHFILLLNGWMEWDPRILMGYIPQAGDYVMLHPGLGLANIIGIASLVLGVVLMITSFDAVARWLGKSSWKWLQSFAYTMFYLSAAHVVYFVFLHYADNEAAQSWFDYPAVCLILVVILLQTAAFVKTVNTPKKNAK